MTATILIKTKEHPKAQIIPNAALAFDLDETSVETLKRKGYKIEPLTKQNSNTVWVLNNKELKQLAVNAHFTNGMYTALREPLSGIDSVLTNLRISNDEDESTPFRPVNNN